MIRGEAVVFAVFIFASFMVLISILTIRMQDAAGEVLPRFGAAKDFDISGKAGVRAWFRPSRRRAQLLTMIITDKQQAVADIILKDMRRGVTAMPGTGMYTGKSHAILMCALTITEVPQLKDLVGRADPNAFVVVVPAQEVLGRGFVPLYKE
jgi:hypothetical protein